ncbi:MAG: hypothetical protein QNJ85_16005 [Gammaproteobacteria bacterium]|nr:hypothetical protein [Gammaproteobacteria bacterium]
MCFLLAENRQHNNKPDRSESPIADALALPARVGRDSRRAPAHEDRYSLIAKPADGPTHRLQQAESSTVPASGIT